MLGTSRHLVLVFKRRGASARRVTNVRLYVSNLPNFPYAYLYRTVQIADESSLYEYYGER